MKHFPDPYKKKDSSVDRHHIVPRSRGGSNIDNNIIRINTTFHQAFHRILGNMTPLEQLVAVVKLNKGALKEDIAEMLIDAIEGFDENRVYKKGVLKHGRVE